jgi:outer membrane protein TolC
MLRAFRRAGSTAGLLAALLPWASARLAAQSAPDSAAPAMSLSLRDLLAEVRRADPRTGAARALATATRARVRAAARPPDPQLQLGFMNYRLPGLAPMADIGMAQLQLMQMLPLGGKLALAGRVASSRASASDARAIDVEWEQRTRAAMLFFDLHAVERRLDVARRTLRLLQDVARSAESMYRTGTGRQIDVLRAQVEIARMAADTLRMQAMRQSLADRLNALRDRDAAALVGSPVLPAFPDSLPSRTWLDSVAAVRRPMINAGREELGAASASSRLARREIVPDLQLGLQYAQRGAAMSGADGAGALVGSRSAERMGSLMIGVSVPVFARDRQLQMRREADAMRAMAEAELAAMRAETRGEVGEAHATLVRARSLTRLYRGTILPHAEAATQSASSAYRSGQLDFMTVLDSRMRINEYQQELATLEADEGKAWSELERLTATELLVDIPPVVARAQEGSR